MRVQIPAYTDRWMMGDRYGDVVKTVRKRRGEWAGYCIIAADTEIAHVRLDVSGKTVKVILDDCTQVA